MAESMGGARCAGVGVERGVMEDSRGEESVSIEAYDKGVVCLDEETWGRGATSSAQESLDLPFLPFFLPEGERPTWGRSVPSNKS